MIIMVLLISYWIYMMYLWFPSPELIQVQTFDRQVPLARSAALGAAASFGNASGSTGRGWFWLSLAASWVFLNREQICMYVCMYVCMCNVM